MVSFLDQSIAIYAKKHAVVVNLNETIGYTFQFMIKYNIRHISIIDEQYKLVGVLTAEDILRTLIHSKNAKFLQLKNHEVMSTDVQFVEDSQTLRDTIILMDKTDVTAMPVLVDGAYDGIFTDKDILQMDRIWRTIPDSSVTSYRGIGRKIFPEDIISKDFTLWEAATHILRNNSRFILIKDEDERFSGMVSVNKILGSIVPLLMFGRSDMSFLKKMKIHTIVRESILSRNSPALIMPTRMMIKNQGMEAVMLFENQRPVKLITQKDIVGHLIDYL